MRTVEKKSRGGRPSKKTLAVVAAVCERLAAGETLSAICREPGMPGRRTVIEWTERDDAVSAQVAKARQLGYDAIAEDAFAIVHEDPERAVDGRIDPAYVQHAKFRLWGRMELLKKWDPKRYGERVQQDVTVTDSLAERLARARERDG